MGRYRFFSAILIFAFALSGPWFSDGMAQDAEPPVLRVVLTVDAPFSTARITVHHDGKIEYWASSPDIGIKEETGSGAISDTEFAELIALIENSGLKSMAQSCSEANILQDVTSYRLTIRSGTSGPEGKRDWDLCTIHCSDPCPKPVEEVINKIKDLWGKDILEVGV
jgi:hypothetical protein